MKLTQPQGLAAGLAALLLVLAALALGSQRSAQQLADSGEALQQRQQALTALATVRADVADAETAADPAVVARARASADTQLATLRQLLSHDPAQYSRLVTLGALLTQRFDALGRTEPRRRGAPAALPDAPQGSVLAAVLALQTPAQAALATSQQQHVDTTSSSRRWLWAGSLVALLATGLLAWLVWRLLHALGRSRADAQHNQQLQTRATSDLQRVLTTTTAPVCVLDADGRFLRSNPACAAIWGRDATALTGQLLLDGVLPDDRRRTQLALDQLLAGEALQGFRHRVPAADGSTRLLDWQAQWSATDNTLVCTGHDITELDALRQQTTQQTQALQQSQADVSTARAQAQQADHVQAQFLSTLGQGLRAPLEHVDNLADVLLQGLSGPLVPTQQRQLQQLQASARQVRAVVQDMLDITRIEAGELHVRREAFDISESITKVAAPARQRAQDKGVLLQLHLADDLGYARGDERRFEQVLSKLLDNAVRCTSAGSITLRARQQADGLLQISVADTGIGIAPADMAKLFQPFRQLGDDPGQGSVGLGLAIAQRLAVLMGGGITASSVLQQGSTFTLSLPSDTAVLRAA